MKISRYPLFVLLVLAAAGSSVSSQAQEKTGNKPGFALQPGQARIVLMRPSVKVGEQSTAGMSEPNADWTDQAKRNLDQAIATAIGGMGGTVRQHVETMGPEAAKVAEYRGLFSTVASSVIVYQFFPGNRLPTKKRKNSFEWTLGPAVKALPGLEDADYALFIDTEDQFGSAGRKALQIFAALAGVGVTSGVHSGYAGLVDLKTGDLVWLNADMQMGGDVRTADGAAKRVAQLFEGFPGKPATSVTVASAAQ